MICTLHRDLKKRLITTGERPVKQKGCADLST